MFPLKNVRCKALHGGVLIWLCENVVQVIPHGSPLNLTAIRNELCPILVLP